MKKTLLLLLTGLTTTCFAQHNIFAVSGDKPGSTNWNQLILQPDNKGQAPLLLDGSLPALFLDAQTRSKTQPQILGSGADETPGMQGIAALAYDRQNNRLYFAPLFRTGGIRYIDLSSNSMQKPVVVYDDAYNILVREKDGQGKNLTRMVIDDQGTGYAISNDGKSFLRFGTGNKVNVENLGSLVDDTRNEKISVFNECTSWGGDMIAADNGRLYLFSLNRNVFEIDPQTRVATHLGVLKGLSPNFTVNGVAVNDKNQIILASSVVNGVKYVMDDLFSLQTEKLIDPEWMNASDLASAYSYRTQAVASKPLAEAATIRTIQAFPNPVTNGNITVVFGKVIPGSYDLQMVSNNGNVLQNKQVQVTIQGQTEKIKVSNYAKGFYMLRLNDANGKQVGTEKIIIQ